MSPPDTVWAQFILLVEGSPSTAFSGAAESGPQDPNRLSCQERLPIARLPENYIRVHHSSLLKCPGYNRFSQGFLNRLSNQNHVKS